MHPLLKAANDHLAVIVTITGSLAVLIPRVRAAIGMVWAWIMLRAGFGKLDEILKKVTAIERELNFNGGNSIRDIVVMQHNRQKEQFWRSLRPSLEIDGDAMVNLVSESACHLFDLADPEELYRRNYLRFVDGGRVGDFLNAFKDTVASRSRFTFVMPLKCIRGNPLGMWEIRLSPLTQPGMSKVLYSGYFKPVCDKAKEVAASIS